MPTDPDAERLRALNERLAAARPKERKAHQQEHYSQAQLAWRMVIELVAGLGIGFGIGYGLDAAFGTQPWLMVVFTLLGFAAGVKTMIASAKEVQGQADLRAAMEHPGAGAPDGKSGARAPDDKDA
ncbi:AtpZ/AtpI family protein [Jannaschia aquimarina]|uniref:ATP synthase protein I n=1 Tax=Jannaschia aquimarina TaxID=935700 RepID=A0A0D1ED05_9RHOB|nr:AtpZ/AtpI family protein [Jannaschia aquimarina]KIT15609.1 ATP synthase protein I [Jannaschia aquimarina]SNT27669.1 ATP synthase protein I [Jannaschia aquimarina]